ncbi:MAG: YsnF/AvaK domain-containing protein [Chitinophagaceae bacterium]
MTQTVIGFFDQPTEAQEAVDKLVSEGFSRSNIDVSVQENSTNLENNSSNYSTAENYNTSKKYNTADDYSTSGSTITSDYKNEHESGITKFFRSLFGNDDKEVNRYSEVARRSGSMVTVHAQSDDEAERAADILDEYGAVDVDERATEYGYSGSTKNTYDTAETDTYDTADTDTDIDTKKDKSSNSVNVIKEDIQIGKRTVETGGKRLRSRIIEKPVEEELRLREEKVSVKRNTVDRPATDAELANFQEGEVELVERAEVPVVSKQARVVEEVSLNKEVNERKETIKDTVRSTEVDVEDIEENEVKRKNRK